MNRYTRALAEQQERAAAAHKNSSSSDHASVYVVVDADDRLRGGLQVSWPHPHATCTTTNAPTSTTST